MLLLLRKNYFAAILAFFKLTRFIICLLFLSFKPNPAIYVAQRMWCMMPQQILNLTSSILYPFRRSFQKGPLPYSMHKSNASEFSSGLDSRLSAQVKLTRKEKKKLNVTKK